MTGLGWAPYLVPLHPLLAELETRAGASDQDEAAWLEQRRTGITATQVRDLWLWDQYRRVGGEKPKYAKTEQELILDKLGIQPEAYVGTKYPEWGKTREPVLANRAAWGYSVDPEHRVFSAADNPRFLASPDGTGVSNGHLRVGEYKTSTKPIPVGSYALKQKGYVAQMVWVMRVLGRTVDDRLQARCIYIWEQHNNHWEDVGKVFPEPTGVLDSGEEWVEYDENLAYELEQIATEFLAHLDAARERVEAGLPPFGDDVLDPDDFEVLVAAYLGAEAARDREVARMAEIAEQIAERAGDGWVDPIVTRAGRVSPVRPAPRRGFDEAAWRRRAPKQWAAYQSARDRYVKFTPVKPSIRVTAPKDEQGETGMEEAA